MIFVDRNATPAPKELVTFHEQEMARLKPLFELPKDERAQFPPDIFRSHKLRDSVRKHLDKLFQGKCAFCERSGATIDHFRPKRRAARGGGLIDNDHYWWLASDWNNLYLCCRECNMRKGNLFPIDGPAAVPFTSGKALVAERPLLVDPCNDDPSLHLRFNADGSVVPLSVTGEVTIKVFELNNPGLVEQRREKGIFITVLCEREWTRSGSLADKSVFTHVVLGQFAPSSVHTAVARAVVNDFFEARTGPTKMTRPAHVALVSPIFPAGTKPESVKAVSTAVWLRRVEIRNFKAITSFDRTFPQLAEGKEDEGQPWLMFLGENGAGKTTILQAVALALMPDAERDAHDGPARWMSKRSGSGHVRLTFTDNSVRELSFSKGDKSFSVHGTVPQMPVLAYGATRLLPDPGKDDARTPTTVSVRNLFDPTFPLIDAERRLCDANAIPDESFAMLVTDLRQLLPAGANAPIKRTKTALNSEVKGQVIPLHDLSGGYKSVLALAMDIMVHLTESSFDMESAQGLVMIDELELHLHPRWKIRIVEQLRGLFPRVRFISCTHDPLCVHGLRSGELHIIAPDPASDDLRVEQYDVPPGTRADEILTGPWFGMQSTMDAGTMELMADHSALLQLEKRTEEQEHSLQLLYRELRVRLGTFGDTPGTRMALAQAARQAANDTCSDWFISDADANPNVHERFNVILRSRMVPDAGDGLA